VIDRLVLFCLRRRAVVYLLTLLVAAAGVIFAPFDWPLGGLPRYPVPVDAIPNVGENQQIVFTDWPGRSPQDVENQITYPLASALLGVPRVKSIRSTSMFGFSIIYIIFEDGAEFYWTRSRVLEKLNSLPPGALPAGVLPALGPDATALGQVFWYTLEGRDPQGRPAGGWDPHELRTIQDWYVRFSLLSAEGVSEVASVGGFVQEYQVDVDPALMRARDAKLEEVVAAVQRSNLDVGARTIEVNRVDYVIRGLGFIRGVEDLKDALIKVNEGVPVFVRHVANVTLGPAARTGALDKAGEEAVGGVVVVRFGANPLKAIQNVRERIDEISPGLPKKTLADGTVSQVRLVPFYDRTGLIYETLGTLSSALLQEILVTIVVVLVMVMHLQSALLIAMVLPLAVLVCFIAMKLGGIEANIVALSGIAIAIGTVGDMGIIVVENIKSHLDRVGPGGDRLQAVHAATREVGGAVVTAIATTMVSFLPVFALTGAEGKLFRPLAFTKTFVLAASVMVALTLIPPLAHRWFGVSWLGGRRRWILHEGMIYAGGLMALLVDVRAGLFLCAVGAASLAARWLPEGVRRWGPAAACGLAVVGVGWVLAADWLPLGPERGLLRNLLFVGLIIGGLLGLFRLFQHHYPSILGWCLMHRGLFFIGPLAILMLGALIWLGFEAVFGWLPNAVKRNPAVSSVAHKFPGLGREFMPPLDEGSFLFMPSAMPHASIREVLDIVRKQDRAIQAIPEVEMVVGKIGRAESALDPAPLSMIETVINYRPRFVSDRDGRPVRFRWDPDGIDLFRDEAGHPVPAEDGDPYLVRGRFARGEGNRLVPDPRGAPFPLWRPVLDPRLNPGRAAWQGIRSPDDIWQAVARAAQVPGTTAAPKLQPISARLVMLQSGIRANMGVKVKGPDLEAIEGVCRAIEASLRQVPSVDPASVIADRIMGIPYLEIRLDRRAMAQYAVDVQQVQETIEVALGGKGITTTVEGRERYSVRVRYLRELRDDLESLGRILIPSPNGAQIPLTQVSDIQYAPGPQMIRGEDSFLVGYVLFDKLPGHAEGDVFRHAREYLRMRTQSGDIALPPGVSFTLTGNYVNQLRSERTLMLIVPMGLCIIAVILYLQFNSALLTALVFACIFLNWAGGFIMLWLYGQSWFLDASVLGASLRELFQVHPVHLSVAVWVGFIALFGVSSDDGVVMGTYLSDQFRRLRPRTVAQIRQTVVAAGRRRIRPCLMTMATTLLALLPVLTSSGRGADIMIPMAIPSFGGLMVEAVTMLVLPVSYCAIEERRQRAAAGSSVPTGSQSSAEVDG
jgi:Cu(I)/Ag(I) efflux system membrane protein CusA/SilA